MCNFFTRHREPRNLQAAFRFPELPNDPPRWVVRPTDTERVVAVGKDGQRHAVPMRWGLIPPSAPDVKIAFTTFNWRSEDFERRRTFSEPFKRRQRCLVPCDGFFEFTGPKDAPLAEPLLSFSIATTSPNATVAPIHDRMSVLFAREAEWDAWLHPDAVPDELRKMLTPAPDDLLDAFPVMRDLLRTKEPGPNILKSTLAGGAND